MYIISNSHSLFDEKLVSSLTDCELPFSLIEGNTNSAVISFIEEDFRSLLNLACDDKELATQLLTIRHRYRAVSQFHLFFKDIFHSEHSEFNPFIWDYFYYLNSTELRYQKDYFLDAFQYPNKNFFQLFHNKLKSFSDFFEQFSELTLSSYFQFLDDSIVIGQYLTISGDDYTRVLEQTKAHCDAHAEYSLTRLGNCQSSWEQYSHFSSLVSNLPDFDMGDSDYKNALFDVLMKAIDLFKFDFDD